MFENKYQHENKNYFRMKDITATIMQLGNWASVFIS